MKNLGFNDTKSTYQTDYVKFTTVRLPQERKFLKETIKPIKQPKFIDSSTLHPFREDVYVPFDLMFRPKDCVNTNPHKKIPDEKLEEKIFEEKLKMRKIRPRVHMIPQICLDDVPEDVMYGENGLAENIYTSDWKRTKELMRKMTESKNNAQTETETQDEEKESDHLIDIQKRMENIRIKPFFACNPIDAGLLKYVKKWDNYQPRAIVDKTAVFWKKNRDKGWCSICEDIKADVNLSAAEKAELNSALEDDQLRIPYAFLAPDYGGYTPKMPVGIPVRKKLFKRYEPFVTTLMQDQGVYLKPKSSGEG